MKNVAELEKAAIGAAITNHDAATLLIDRCTPEDFVSLRSVFEELVAMRKRGEELTIVTVAGALKGKISPAKLAECAEACAVASSVGTIAKQLREASVVRRVEKSVSSIAQSLRADASSEALIDEWERLGFEARSMRESGEARDRLTSEELANEFNDDFMLGGDEERIPFPLESLRREHGGYQRGDLIFLGGYSGDGKSVMGLQFLEAACESGLSVGYFSLEMPALQVQRRLIAMGGIPLKSLKHRSASVESVGRRAMKISEWKYAVHSGSTTAAKIRGEQARHKYDVVIVDHLHRMNREGDRREGLESNAVALKNLALDLECGVVCLGQLSRAKDGGFPMPTTQQIRDTAVIEHEADMVCFIYRVRSPDQNPLNDARFIIGKMRDGRSGYYEECKFEPSSMRFSEQLMTAERVMVL